MNHVQFLKICEAVAQALETDATHADDRCSLLIDGTEVLLDFDNEHDSGTLLCYIDLGEANPHDRAQTCELLLDFNLSTCATHGAYAFDINSARAVFCARLADTETLSGDDIAEILEFYVDETASARQMIANPAIYSGDTQNAPVSFLSPMALA